MSASGAVGGVSHPATTPQAVALAAKLLGTSATIVMPADAPGPVKLDATRGATAPRVVTYEPLETRDRVAIGTRDRRGGGGLTLVHPFDDPLVAAGQGTAATRADSRTGATWTSSSRR